MVAPIAGPVDVLVVERIPPVAGAPPLTAQLREVTPGVVHVLKPCSFQDDDI